MTLMEDTHIKLKQILETELEDYVCFSPRQEDSGYIHYTDEKFPDMYDHNFYYFENGSVLRIAAEGKGHVKILFEPGWEPSLDDPAFTPFARETCLFMGAVTDDYSLLQTREDGFRDYSSARHAEEEQRGGAVLRIPGG